VTRRRTVKVKISAAARKYIFHQKNSAKYSRIAFCISCGTPVTTMPMMPPMSHGRASRATCATDCRVMPLPRSRRSTMSTAPASIARNTRCIACTRG
jgi:hypothetical protein